MKLDDGISEKELVARLVEGDKEAFCKLYVLYKKQLMFFAFKFLKSTSSSEDVVQDTFTYVWLGRKFIQVDIPFSAYLYMIVKNRVLNQLRSLDRQHLLLDHIRAYAMDYTENTQDEILSHDMKEVINKAFKALSPRQQEVLRMSREEGMSYKEIADTLGISVNTVHEHITSSLYVIRHYLMKYSKVNIDMILFFALFTL